MNLHTTRSRPAAVRTRPPLALRWGDTLLGVPHLLPFRWDSGWSSTRP